MKVVIVNKDEVVLVVEDTEYTITDIRDGRIEISVDKSQEIKVDRFSENIIDLEVEE